MIQSNTPTAPKMKSKDDYDDDDDEVEEWFDFSQSGDWEKSIGKLENIFREWNLINTTCPNNKKTLRSRFKLGVRLDHIFSNQFFHLTLIN